MLIAGTKPLASRTYADTIALLLIASWIDEYNSLICENTGRSYLSLSMSNLTSILPAFFNSGVIISCSLATSIANEHNVGGTSICSNVPDIESLPPIDGSPKPICASYAPRSAANGWLHLEGSSVILLKYS